MKNNLKKNQLVNHFCQTHDLCSCWKINSSYAWSIAWVVQLVKQYLIHHFPIWYLPFFSSFIFSFFNFLASKTNLFVIFLFFVAYVCTCIFTTNIFFNKRKKKKKNLITKELCDLRISLPMLNILLQQLQYLHVHRGECDDWLMCMKSFCVVKCWFIGRPSAWLYLSTTVISRIWIFRNVHINTVIVENRCPGIYSSWEFFSFLGRKRKFPWF